MHLIIILNQQVYIHSNREYFGWDFSPQLSWEPNQVSEILISMKETYTTEDAKQLSIGYVLLLYLIEHWLPYL